MRVLLIFLVFLFIFPDNVLAQGDHFITSGTIEFEKVNNMFALLKRVSNDVTGKAHYEKYLQTQPQFVKLNSVLVFDSSTSLYTPIARTKPIPSFYDSPMISEHDVVFSDFKNHASTIQKEFYERTYLVKDSLRRIKWKITEETSVIAGYNCRRANGLVLDSIYVVAFYTEDIHVPGGPASFNGLPGMILRVAIPHENVSWIATKITESSIDENRLIAPKKGKLVNNKQLYDELWKFLGSKGEIGLYFMKGWIL